MNWRANVSWGLFLDVLIVISLVVALVMEFHDEPDFYKRLAFWTWVVITGSIAFRTIFLFVTTKNAKENIGLESKRDS